TIMKVVEMDDYLQITLPELWNLDDFVSWCGSCEKLKGDKVKILDHIKKRLEKTDNNKLIKEDIRQKAKDLRKEFQAWKSSPTTTKYFEQLENRYQTERKLQSIENEKVIELAEIERIKVSQLRNNAEAVSKIHQCVSDSFMEFSNETIRIPKRTLESEVLAKEQDDHEELQNKRTRYVQTPPSSAEEGSRKLKSLQPDEVLLRKTLIGILNKFKSKDHSLGKTFMDSNFLNNIIDLTDNEMKHETLSTLNLDQKLYLDKMMPVTESKFLVRKSFIEEYFDPFLHEGYDIVHDIMNHFSVRLEAPNNSESNVCDRYNNICYKPALPNASRRSRTDMILTKDTNKRKIDGALKVIKMRKKEHQTICIVEFSYGKLAPENKEISDDVKLARNATRILNKLLDSVPCKKARVYTIQCVNGQIHIRFMVRPLPSVYLYEEFVCIKIPTSFDDIEQFSMDMKMLMDFQCDVLKTVKSVNKPVEIKNVDKFVVEITPKKKARKKST
ncbi:3039_t:CDS:2, partial [Funneliformis caledonium]